MKDSSASTTAMRRSISAWSMPAFPDSDRTAPIATGRASTRSRRAWADSCRSPGSRGRARCAPASRSPIFARACCARTAFCSRYRAANLRRGPVGHDLAAGGADFHAGFPGLALADEGRGAEAGRQQSPAAHPHRRVQDRRRPINIAATGASDLEALLPRRPTVRICSIIPTTRPRRPLRATATR